MAAGLAVLKLKIRTEKLQFDELTLMMCYWYQILSPKLMIPSATLSLKTKPIAGKIFFRILLQRRSIYAKIYA